MGEWVERRLAAVLAADVAGYSRLMGADEVGTLSALKAIRREIVDPAINEHKGRIVKTTGDGLLVEFASAVDAVTCAMSIQAKIAERKDDTPQMLHFRIGINVGDIIIDGDDIFGDGVNVAARVEGECTPGGVYLSGSAYDQIRGKTPFAFDDLGEKSLKNIERPVRLYGARPAGSQNASNAASKVPTAAALPLPDKPSIAVLPFQNMSGDPEQEYFADGMVEDIITALSRFKFLFVIARNSSFTYKGKAVDIKQVGRELGVSYLLEGSVRKAGGRVRITGQLIEAATGAHLWADKFDGALEDIFELQDAVTTSVVGAVAPKLVQANLALITRKPADSWEAYDLHWRGSLSFQQWTLSAMKEALDHYRKAIELNPNFGLAYATAANCVYQLWNVFSQPLTNDQRAEALMLAETGIKLASDDDWALTAATWPIGAFGDDWERAASLADRAIALNPNYSRAHNARGWMSINLGTPEQAPQHFARAMRLNPVDPVMVPNVCSGFAAAYTFLGECDNAIDWAKRLLSYRSNDIIGLMVLAGNAAWAGQENLAQSAVTRFREAYPSVRRSHLREAYRVRMASHQAMIESVLELLGLPE